MVRAAANPCLRRICHKETVVMTPEESAFYDRKNAESTY